MVYMIKKPLGIHIVKHLEKKSRFDTEENCPIIMAILFGDNDETEWNSSRQSDHP